MELQNEIREIPDGSVQKLLQRLLRVEEVVGECKQRSQRSGVTNCPKQEVHHLQVVS